ncbi:hypothetical protein [Rhodohalobacter mucosus]|uniref:Uncharacterized protein n=1 Tax=Rhodohalobacter mucosus TaxID=2079485 RepID=A0A316TVT1_9BACT|nr:hypothetical protein [Rhodohalobacter mucosus]PWN07265.1 hypothetical protein DDZ15_05545 [Rhodohalobacter mucosus]
MTKYHSIYLIWLLPLYFLFQFGYQVATYQGISNTYSNGDSYLANVVEFDVKQIAAQTNGYVILKFSTDGGKTIEQKLTLPVQMAQAIMESEVIPIRYLEDSFKPIVMLPTYELQKSVIKVNFGVMGIGLIITVILSFFASRYAASKIKYGDREIEIERVDSEE